MRTVSDTKRSFYSYHTHPINSIYRRVVEELMVEMHLLSVNVDFRYNPIYSLGVVTSFDQFMQGYQPQSDQESIFTALCQAVEDNPQQYRQDAEGIKGFAQKFSSQELIDWLANPTPQDGTGEWLASWQEVVAGSKFKYSRLFGVGLYTLLEQIDSELIADEKRLQETLTQFSEAMSFSSDKMLKDMELYKGNLLKMNQAKAVMEDALEAERKKRQKRALEKTEKEPTQDQEAKKETETETETNQ